MRNWLHLACCLALVCVVAGKKAIVTLLSGSPQEAERYVRLLHFFVYSLRNAGYNGEIAVMYAKDFPVNTVKLSQLLNVRMIPVDKISVNPGPKGNAHYSSMLTKLHLWSLTDYEQIIYYDCDFIFQGNPESAFNQCLWSSLCATPDTGISDFNKAIRPGTYFNGGFLVIRPDKTQYKFLLANKHLAEGRFFVEQDLLNQLYKDKWGKLEQTYNLMHCYRLKKIAPNVVAIHEKMWILRKTFTDSRYIWNSGKMQINYPISDVLTPVSMQQQRPESIPTIKITRPKRPVAQVKDKITEFSGPYSVQRPNSNSTAVVRVVPQKPEQQGLGDRLNNDVQAAATITKTPSIQAVVDPAELVAQLVKARFDRHSDAYSTSINRAPVVRRSHGYIKKGRANSLVRPRNPPPALQQETTVQYKSQVADTPATGTWKLVGSSDGDGSAAGGAVRNTLVYNNDRVVNSVAGAAEAAGAVANRRDENAAVKH